MNVSAETFHKAIEFAVKAHEGVYRKGNKAPYITHPMAVMCRLMMVKNSSNMFLLGTVAMLHDCVEDCENVTLQVIVDQFGLYVAALVDELTSDKTLCDQLGKKEYLAVKMAGMSSYALVIKLCDRLENIIDMKSMGTKFQKKYYDETNYIVNQVVENRSKLTDTHSKLIGMIKIELTQYQNL